MCQLCKKCRKNKGNYGRKSNNKKQESPKELVYRLFKQADTLGPGGGHNWLDTD